MNLFLVKMAFLIGTGAYLGHFAGGMMAQSHRKRKVARVRGALVGALIGLGILVVVT